MSWPELPSPGAPGPPDADPAVAEARKELETPHLAEEVLQAPAPAVAREPEEIEKSQGSHTFEYVT